MKYENFISLGYFCSVAMQLEKYGLRSFSSPFDWTISSISGVIDCISNNFNDFLSYEYLAQRKECRNIYKNVKYNISFYHDFDRYHSLEEQLPLVKKKYEKRIKTFYEAITKPTLFVRYIASEENQFDGLSQYENEYIENNYERINQLLKKFNKENEIVFICNNDCCLENIPNVFYVFKDDNYVAARNCIEKQNKLLHYLLDCSSPELRNKNLLFVKNKIKSNSLLNRIRIRSVKKIKKILGLEYKHTFQI